MRNVMWLLEMSFEFRGHVRELHEERIGGGGACCSFWLDHCSEITNICVSFQTLVLCACKYKF